jgi:hypothetical protein
VRARRPRSHPGSWPKARPAAGKRAARLRPPGQLLRDSARSRSSAHRAR